MFIYDKEIFRRPKQIFSRKGHHIFFGLTRAIAAMLQRIKNSQDTYHGFICGGSKSVVYMRAAGHAGVKETLVPIYKSATVK